MRILAFASFCLPVTRKRPRTRRTDPDTRASIRPSCQSLSWKSLAPALVCILLLSGPLAGCATGVAEFRLHVKAFDDQYDQGQLVLNALARAERKLVKAKIDERPYDQFNPGEAAYYLDNVDPPITASIRASYKSLKSFMMPLGALANGEAAAALSNRIGTLVTNLSDAAAATRLAAAGFAIAPAAVLLGKTFGYLTSAQDILKPLLTAASLQSFRTEILRTYPAMYNLLEELREGTAVMYIVFRESHRDKNGHTSKAGRDELAKERELLAGWVVLMDRALYPPWTPRVQLLRPAPHRRTYQHSQNRRLSSGYWQRRSRACG